MDNSWVSELVAAITRNRWLRFSFAAGIVVGTAALVFWGMRSTTRKVVDETRPILSEAVPRPKVADVGVAIDSPITEASVPVRKNGDGSGSFIVSGTVGTLPQGATVYLLLKPIDPAAEEWWVMPPPVVDSTTWRGVAYIGNTQYPPKPGYQYALRAVIAAKGTRNGQSLLDPTELNPLAQSKTVFVRAGQIE